MQQVSVEVPEQERSAALMGQDLGVPARVRGRTAESAAKVMEYMIFKF